MMDQLLQIVLAGLLVLTIIWCVLVHQKLRRLRAPESETAVFIESLTDATERAGTLLEEIKDSVEVAERSMAHQEKRVQQKLDQVTRLARRIEARGLDELPGKRREQEPDFEAKFGLETDDGREAPKHKSNEALRLNGAADDSQSSVRAAELMRSLQGLR